MMTLSPGFSPLGLEWASLSSVIPPMISVSFKKSLLLQTPLLPSVVHSGPGLGCSGDKDVLSCFLGELHPSCTLPDSRAWVVLGKGTWNHLSPSLHTC